MAAPESPTRGRPGLSGRPLTPIVAVGGPVAQVASCGYAPVRLESPASSFPRDRGLLLAALRGALLSRRMWFGLAHPELVDEDAEPRVVLVVAGAVGDQVGGAGVGEVDIWRLLGEFVIGICPQLGAGRSSRLGGERAAGGGVELIADDLPLLRRRYDHPPSPMSHPQSVRRAVCRGCGPRNDSGNHRRAPVSGVLLSSVPECPEG